jgi:1-deoxy-D-xylulose-5-phosphate reductoisomerase
LRKIAIFGSTGSIGTQAAGVVSMHPDSMEVSLLACGRNLGLFRRQLAELRPALAVTGGAPEDAREAGRLAEDFPGIRFLSGPEGLAEAAGQGEYDLMLNALTGIAGLVPTWEAIRSGRPVALANKETLVAGGAPIMSEAGRRGLPILPVDSEHSAIFQALQGNDGNRPKRIVLTASGGPFRGYTKEMLRDVGPEQALSHPNWRMGRKISVDSATMMNKGLEMIEAGWLFGVGPDAIEVAVHPQSVVHSMVEFDDHSIIAQLGAPDMRASISYALSCPSRWETGVARLDFFEIGALTFERPDTDAFSCLRIAREAMEAGKSFPAAMNAANEALVGLFLEGRIAFADIADILERVMQGHSPTGADSLDEIMAVDGEARRRAAELAAERRAL